MESAVGFGAWRINIRLQRNAFRRAVGDRHGQPAFSLAAARTEAVPYLPLIVILALAVTCFAGKLFLPWLSTFMGDHRLARGTLIGNAGLCVMAAAIVEFLPALAMGILFPVFVDLTREHATRVAALWGMSMPGTRRIDCRSVADGGRAVSADRHSRRDGAGYGLVLDFHAAGGTAQ